ncbi:hypothetical protein D9757_004591 [Collybiopsis confluens]|uniref:Retrotransposon gag domain-containing protein n=1 Tax=Collybiopsis confluens TaxID=2823264 RepID=A0A8H5HS99_9AGAR|nr:hypothetical protein D9757_004591 [Collybiopsis confluens]
MTPSTYHLVPHLDLFVVGTSAYHLRLSLCSAASTLPSYLFVTRTIFMSTYLAHGTPKMWFNGFSTIIKSDFKIFCQAFENHFGDSDPKGTANSQLQALHQEHCGSTANYYSRYSELRPRVDWTNFTLIDTFTQGLKPRVKDALKFVLPEVCPKVFDAFASMCVKYDNLAWKEEQNAKRERGDPYSTEASEPALSRSYLPSPLKPLLCCLALLLRHTVAPYPRSVVSDLFVTLGQDPYCCADCLPPRPSPHKPLPSRPPPSLTAPAASTVLTPVTTPFSISEKPKIPCPNASADRTAPEILRLGDFQVFPIGADKPPPSQPKLIPAPTKPDNPLFSDEPIELDEPIDLDDMPAQPGSSSAPPPPMTTEQIIHALAEQVANLTAAVSGRAAAKSSMNKPDLFKGQSSTEARRFLAQFLAWASEQPDLKSNQGKTIKSALGFLTDKAADWATPYLNEYNNGRVPFSGLWQSFVAAFKLRFESVDPEMEARAAMETIHQGKGQSAAEYSQHFKDVGGRTAYSRRSDATWS